MGIEIHSDLVPKNDGYFPTHSAIHGKGSYQVRADITDRDSIPSLNRVEGMRVYVISTDTEYRLVGGITNGDWDAIKLGGIQDTADINGLKALDVSQLDEGSLVFVTSLRAYFRLENIISPVPSIPYSDNISLIQSTNDTNIYWFRLLNDEPRWQYQPTWYVNPTSGSDEADGYTSVTSIKTFRELNRRLNGKVKRTINVHIMDDVVSSDPINMDLEIVPTNFDLTPRINFIGSLDNPDNATLSGATFLTPASNIAPSFTITGATYAYGDLVKLTSGANSGTLSFAYDGTKVCPYTELTTSYDITTGITNPSIPNGTTADVYVLYSANNVRINISGYKDYSESSIAPPTESLVTFKYLHITNIDVNYGEFGNCFIDTGKYIGTNLEFNGCIFTGTETTLYLNDRSIFRDCLFGSVSGRTVYAYGAKDYLFNRCVFDNCELIVTDNAFAYLKDTGIFNSSANALPAGFHVKGGKVSILNLYGTTHTIALKLTDGGEINVLDSGLPTLTGTTQLSIDNSSTHVPPPLKGTGSILGPLPLSTWANWQNNFFKSYIGTQYSSRLYNVSASIPTDTVTLTSATTIANTDVNVYLDSSLASFAVTLPTAKFIGERHFFKDIEGACLTYPVSILGTPNLIDGNSYFSIDKNYESVCFEWNGTNWSTVLTNSHFDNEKYSQIQDEGSNLTKRSTLNFTGGGVTASDSGSITVVNIPGIVTQDEGVSLTQRSTINFVGSGVAATDTGSKINVTIPSITIKNDSTTFTHRDIIKFPGTSSNVSDNGSETVVNVQAYNELAKNNVSVTKRDKINFTGTGVTVTDNVTKTDVNIPFIAVENENVDTGFAASTPIINFTGDGVDAVMGGGQLDVTIPGAYDRVQDEGVDLTKRHTMNFVGLGVNATDDGTKTVITINGNYNQIRDEGSNVTQRQVLDFIGHGVTVTDGGTKTNVSIPGIQIQDEGNDLPKRSTINFVGAGVVAADNAGITTVTISGGGGGSGYSTIQNEGSSLTQRTSVNFTGAGVNASDNGSLTVVNVDGYYNTIQDEGVDLTKRFKINFTGAGVTATDNGSVTVVNIPGGGGGSGSGILIVNDISELENVTPSDDGYLTYVKSLRSYFKLQQEQTESDSSSFVTSNTIGYYWSRIPTDDSKWQNQNNWYINPSSGNDENDGSIGNPIKTFKEFSLRLNGKLKTYKIVNILNDVVSSDPINLTLQNEASNESDGYIAFIGQLVSITSGTISGAIGAPKTSNIPYQISTSIADGYFIKDTVTNLSAFTLGTGLSYRGVSPWLNFDDRFNGASNLLNAIDNGSSFPSNGNSANLYYFTNIGDVRVKFTNTYDSNHNISPTYPTGFGSERLLFKSVNIGSIDADHAVFRGCTIKNTKNGFGNNTTNKESIFSGNKLWFYGCAFEFLSGGFITDTTTSNIIFQGNNFTFTHCSFDNRVPSKKIEFQGQNAQIIDSVIFGQTLVSSGAIANFNKTGIYNCDTYADGYPALTVDSSFAYLTNTTNGTTNDIGVSVINNGVLSITDGYPIITGTLELKVDNVTNHIPPVLNGGSTILSSRPLSSWSNWVNNFYKSHVGLQYGSKILSPDSTGLIPTDNITVSSNTTIDNHKSRVFVSSSSGPFTVTLNATPFSGQRHTIKDIDGLASSNTITINGNGINMDGAATYVLSDYESITLEYTGTVWILI